MRCFVMLVTTVFVLFQLKLKWPKNKSFFLMRLIFPPSLQTVLHQVREIIYVFDASSALTLSSFSTLILITLVFRLLILIHLFPASFCNISRCYFSAPFLQTEVLHHQRSLGHQVLVWSSNYHLVFWSSNPWQSSRRKTPDILHPRSTPGLTSNHHTFLPGLLQHTGNFIEEFCHSHDLLLNTKPLDDDP